MARSNFALGVVVGGLAGFAAGYLLSRNGQVDADQHGPDSIDLTPAMMAEEPEVEKAKAESAKAEPD